LKFGSNHGIFTPTMHVKGGFGKHKGAGVGDVGALVGNTTGGGIEGNIRSSRGRPVGSTGGRKCGSSGGTIHGTGHFKDTGGYNEVARGSFCGATKGVDGVGKSINGIGVVKGLGTQGLEKNLGVIQRGAVIYVGIGLNNPDEFLARVVEIQLDLVGRRTHGFITSELHLFNEVFVRILCHLTTFVRVQEHIVNVEGGSHQGLLVRNSGRHGSGTVFVGEGLDGPQAFTDGADIKVDFHFVILYESHIPSLSGYLLVILILFNQYYI